MKIICEIKVEIVNLNILNRTVKGFVNYGLGSSLH